MAIYAAPTTIHLRSLPPDDENVCGESTQQMPQKMELTENGQWSWKQGSDIPVREKGGCFESKMKWMDTTYMYLDDHDKDLSQTSRRVTGS